MCVFDDVLLVTNLAIDPSSVSLPFLRTDNFIATQFSERGMSSSKSNTTTSAAAATTSTAAATTTVSVPAAPTSKSIGQIRESLCSRPNECMCVGFCTPVDNDAEGSWSKPRVIPPYKMPPVQVKAETKGETSTSSSATASTVTTATVIAPLPSETAAALKAFESAAHSMPNTDGSPCTTTTTDTANAVKAHSTSSKPVTTIFATFAEQNVVHKAYDFTGPLCPVLSDTNTDMTNSNPYDEWMNHKNWHHTGSLAPRIMGIHNSFRNDLRNLTHYYNRVESFGDAAFRLFRSEFLDEVRYVDGHHRCEEEVCSSSLLRCTSFCPTILTMFGAVRVRPFVCKACVSTNGRVVRDRNDEHSASRITTSFIVNPHGSSHEYSVGETFHPATKD